MLGASGVTGEEKLRADFWNVGMATRAVQYVKDRDVGLVCVFTGRGLSRTAVAWQYFTLTTDAGTSCKNVERSRNTILSYAVALILRQSAHAGVTKATGEKSRRQCLNRQSSQKDRRILRPLLC